VGLRRGGGAGRTVRRAGTATATTRCAGRGRDFVRAAAGSATTVACVAGAAGVGRGGLGLRSGLASRRRSALFARTRFFNASGELRHGFQGICGPTFQYSALGLRRVRPRRPLGWGEAMGFPPGRWRFPRPGFAPITASASPGGGLVISTSMRARGSTPAPHRQAPDWAG
jgi:hypothetical protein